MTKVITILTEQYLIDHPLFEKVFRNDYESDKLFSYLIKLSENTKMRVHYARTCEFLPCYVGIDILRNGGYYHRYHFGSLFLEDAYDTIQTYLSEYNIDQV